jgi:hypothetical protein
LLWLLTQDFIFLIERCKSSHTDFNNHLQRQASGADNSASMGRRVVASSGSVHCEFVRYDADGGGQRAPKFRIVK